MWYKCFPLLIFCLFMSESVDKVEKVKRSTNVAEALKAFAAMAFFSSVFWLPAIYGVFVINPRAKEEDMRDRVRNNAAVCIEGRAKGKGITPYELFLSGDVGDCQLPDLSQSDLDRLFFTLSGDNLINCIVDRLDIFLRTNLVASSTRIDVGAHTNQGGAEFSAEACLPDRFRPGKEHIDSILSMHAPRVRVALQAKGWNLDSLKVVFQDNKDAGGDLLLGYVIGRLLSY